MGRFWGDAHHKIFSQVNLLLCLLQKLWRKPSKIGRPSLSPSCSSSSKLKSAAAPKSSEIVRVKRYAERVSLSPNVSPKPRTPTAVVLHHSGGSYVGGVAWILNPSSRVSYHVLVAADGRRTVFAKPSQRTWHAGQSEWHGRKDLNSWSVGAAFAGDSYAEPLTQDAMASMAEYLVPVMREYGIGMDMVTDHRTVSPGRKNDLNPVEFARFKKYLATKL
jgi:N-acetyl-anhydromuramyl-L-alanine amidase AmpD